VLRVAEDDYVLKKGKYLLKDDGHVAFILDAGIGGREAAARKELDKEPTFDAPKATLMSYIVDGILQRKLPWAFVLLGVLITLVLELCGVSALPFAVGLYLPIYTVTPIFVGGVVKAIVDRVRKRRGEKATRATPAAALLFSSGSSPADRSAASSWPRSRSVSRKLLEPPEPVRLARREGRRRDLLDHSWSMVIGLALFTAMTLTLYRVASKPSDRK